MRNCGKGREDADKRLVLVSRRISRTERGAIAACPHLDIGVEERQFGEPECVRRHSKDRTRAALKRQTDERLSVGASEPIVSFIAGTPGSPQDRRRSWFFTEGVTRVTSIMGKMFNKFLSFLVMLFVAAVTLFVWTFPDAPIRPCGAEQFCGRSDGPHTQADFRKYVVLERAMLFTLPLSLAAGGILVWRRRRRAQYLGRILAKQRELSPAVEDLRYEAAWKARDRRKKAALVLGLAAILTVVSRNIIGFPAPQLTFALVVVAFVAFIWLRRFACPRCRELFAPWRSPERCRCCGLPLGATFKESLGELEVLRAV
jgi:hypothetical protein